jgi:phenylacetate-CoA ligase
LRGRSNHDEFLRQFCCAPATEIAEYWRSGGTTGTPVFYPRTHEDIRYGLLAWGRSFPCMGNKNAGFGGKTINSSRC